MKALDDLLWLKEQLEKEREFDDRAPSAVTPTVAERILARIQPAIDALGVTQKQSTQEATPFSMKDPPPCYMGVCVKCGLAGEGPDRMGECIVCYPCLNAEARQCLRTVEEDLEDYKRYLKMSHATNKRRGKVIADLKAKLDDV